MSAKNAISAAYFCAFAGLGLCIASLGPALLDLAHATGSNLKAMGYIFTARAFGYLLGAMVSGPLFDSQTLPAQLILAAALLATGIGSIAVPFSHAVQRDSMVECQMASIRGRWRCRRGQ